MTDIETIRRVYDEVAEEEYRRLTKSPLHEAEWFLTVDLLEDYVSTGNRVLDVGAGPGLYAEHLVNKGCRVGLVDLSSQCLCAFRSRVGPSVIQNVLFMEVASATDLAWLEPNSFDAVLVMGPLYHLVTDEEKHSVLDACHRALRPDGHLVASFISPYQALIYPYQRGEKPIDRRTSEQILRDGVTFHRGMQQWRCWPSQAKALIEGRGFEIIRMRNLEGLGLLLDSASIANLADPERKRQFFDLLRATCEIPDILGATWHYVCVAQCKV